MEQLGLTDCSRNKGEGIAGDNSVGDTTVIAAPKLHT